MTKLLRREAVMEMLGVKRTKFASMIADGEIPRPVIVSGTVRCWRENDIIAFIESRPVDENYPHTN